MEQISANHKQRPKWLKPLIAIAIFILGCFTFNLFTRGVWALPFAGQPIATVKTTNREISEEKYYTLYSNGDKVELSNVPDEVRESNEIHCWGHNFTTADIRSAAYTTDENSQRHVQYTDAEANKYDKIPVTPDPVLLDIADDFFSKTQELHAVNSRFFRDGDTIFVVILRDCGFGRSARKFYAYDIPSRRLRYLNSLPTNEEADWVYTK